MLARRPMTDDVLCRANSQRRSLPLPPPMQFILHDAVYVPGRASSTDASKSPHADTHTETQRQERVSDERRTTNDERRTTNENDERRTTNDEGTKERQ